MSTALITGGAGFVGTNLCLELKRRGFTVVCLDNNHMEREPLFDSEGIEFLYWDVLDAERMKAACRDIDVVFHLATMCLPYSLEKDPRYTLKVSAEGTLNVFEACHSPGNNAFFVYVSSSQVYGRGHVPMEEGQAISPTTIYGAAKAAGELVTLAHGQQHSLPYLIVRPFNCYGPYAREDAYATIVTKMLRAFIHGDEVQVYGDGKQSRDFTYISNTVDGIVTAYERRDKLKLFPTVNVCSGRETGLDELWILCRQASSLGAEDARLVYGPPRPGDITRMLGSTWYCKNMTGWQAQVSLEEGLAKYAKWLSEKHEYT